MLGIGLGILGVVATPFTLGTSFLGMIGFGLVATSATTGVVSAVTSEMEGETTREFLAVFETISMTTGVLGVFAEGSEIWRFGIGLPAFGAGKSTSFLWRLKPIWIRDGWIRTDDDLLGALFNPLARHDSDARVFLRNVSSRVGEIPMQSLQSQSSLSRAPAPVE